MSAGIFEECVLLEQLAIDSCVLRALTSFWFGIVRTTLIELNLISLHSHHFLQPLLAAHFQLGVFLYAVH